MTFCFWFVCTQRPSISPYDLFILLRFLEFLLAKVDLFQKYPLHCENNKIWFHTAVVKIIRSLCQYLLKVFFWFHARLPCSNFVLKKWQKVRRVFSVPRVARSFYRKAKMLTCQQDGENQKTRPTLM